MIGEFIDEDDLTAIIRSPKTPVATRSDRSLSFKAPRKASDRQIIFGPQTGGESFDPNTDRCGDLEFASALTIEGVENRDHVPANLSSENDSPQTYFSFLRSKAVTFYQSILYPRYFIIFNIICLVQTVPAITYYVLFFSPGWYLKNSTGMPPVWGATVGAIATTIVTSALVPLPPNTVTKEFCIAVILWELLVSVSLFIAGICLSVLKDAHGAVWSFVGSISTAFSFVFLRWLALSLQHGSVRSTTTTDKEQNSPTGNLATYIPDTEQRHDPSLSGVQRGPLDIPIGAFSGDENNNLSSGRYRQRPDSALQITSHEPNHPVTDETIHNQKNEMSSLQLLKFHIIQVLLWTILFVFAVIPAGFAVNQSAVVWEQMHYSAPGSLFSIPACLSSASTCRDVSMHIHCIGPAADTVSGTLVNRPTLVMEADNFTSGFSLWNLQTQLSELGWRSCAYDRVGYGWSSMPPLGATNPIDTVYRLSTLLSAAGEAQGDNNTLLIGHGGGAEIAQMYALAYPTRVAGLAIIDGYSNLDRLLEHSTQKIHEDTLAACGTLNLGRALESVALMRAVTRYRSDRSLRDKSCFSPCYESSRYLSTQTNGKYWEAQFSDVCVHAGAASANTDFLSSRTNSSSSSSGGYGYGQLGTAVRWPSIPTDVPVLIVSASATISGSDAVSSIYRRQAQLYNETLSPTGTSQWITCRGCKHSLASDEKSYWLAAKIDSYFGLFYPMN